ncbi:PAS domain-containing hybrid sensor histidine kinase/response regulator [Mesorhizobium sp. CO1-1-8]|uniref:PAS domain-containing hybrid sensor histidine kinase/response regulator n=1 Tax=Mesorhizobium sp. CO1-1-8 TaxID=2876631 RepID=UPI001CD07C40|nr:PAS domain-containing hybrid sensor histidine kinase/response regulator [Mesorhizobium sp. CO1-1-8]MBZ9775001.1 response regulator [Mesorhizobium sp. CO1-1-8]
MVASGEDARSVEWAELKDLFETAPCGYISATRDGVIQRVNQTFCEWLGIKEHHLVGKRLPDLLPIAGKIYYETHFAPLLRMQGEFREVALDFLKADGSRLPALVNARERRDADGVPQFVRLTIFNATDRRRYEQELLSARATAERASDELQRLNAIQEQRIADEVADRVAAEETLRQAQKMEAVGQLTGGIAHDFNNMLAVIIAGLNLIQRRVSQGDTDIGKLIEASMDGATKAAALTQRLLAFSRQQPLDPEPVNANGMVSEMSELLRRTLGETVHMETVLASGLWKTVADRNQLENVIVNLAVNARDAMADGGRLTIETGNAGIDDAYAGEHAITPGQYVMIAVTDTGTGMTPDVIAKAFDPFYTTKGVGKGTGLGLSQVFGFVKQSSGHVKIYSEIGHGTTVKIYLPRYYGTGVAPARKMSGDTPVGIAEEVILVVEDDYNVRELTGQMLRDLGYGVLSADGGQSGLRMLHEHPEVKLLLTDVVMPDMNGRQLVEEALQLRTDLKVIYTTGYTRNAIVHNGVLDPDVQLLQKPATLKVLAQKVRAVLDS